MTFAERNTSPTQIFVNSGMISTFPTPGVSTTPSVNSCADFKDLAKKAQIMEV